MWQVRKLSKEHTRSWRARKGKYLKKKLCRWQSFGSWVDQGLASPTPLKEISMDGKVSSGSLVPETQQWGRGSCGPKVRKGKSTQCRQGNAATQQGSGMGAGPGLLQEQILYNNKNNSYPLHGSDDDPSSFLSTLSVTAQLILATTLGGRDYSCPYTQDENTEMANKQGKDAPRPMSSEVKPPRDIMMYLSA